MKHWMSKSPLAWMALGTVGLIIAAALFMASAHSFTFGLKVMAPWWVYLMSGVIVLLGICIGPFVVGSAFMDDELTLIRGSDSD